MAKQKKISEAEWIIMSSLWKRSPQTAQELIDEVAEQNDWNPRTVKTLINRLVQKEVLGFSKDGRKYAYHPIAEESDCVQSEATSFLKRVFDGALEPMFTHFVENEQLSNDEIDRLQKILDDKKAHNGKEGGS